MLDALMDAVIDSVKLLPFLYLTYVAMEWLEHKMSDKYQNRIVGAGKVGPLWGGIIGAFPQCGFSAAASNFYAGRVITLGTLIAIYLSTSDEMLPIFISESVPLMVILKILGLKVIIGVISGFIIEFIFINVLKKHEKPMHIHEMCEEEHCHCDHGIFRSALHHTLKIFIFIFIVSALINVVIALIGEDQLRLLFTNMPIIGELIAGIVGLIPNCAASVVITQLYLEGIIGAGAMMSGLLVGAGVGLLILFRLNKDLKENIYIVLLLYGVGVFWGVIIDLLGITF